MADYQVVQECYTQESANALIVGNGNIELALDRRNGNLIRLSDRRKGMDWNKRPGRVEVHDELLDRHFTSGESPMETFDILAESNEVIVSRRFAGAQWTMKETFRSEQDAVHWEVELALDDGAADRSVVIRQLVPWPRQPFGWRVWSASHHFPSRVQNLGGLHLEYGDVWFGTLIPAVTIYDPGKDVGLVMAKPFGLPAPRLRFHFMDYNDSGVDVENDLLGLRSGHPARAALMLRFHEGCFRPTLAWLLEKYPEYFLPGNPGVRALEGGSTFGPPNVTEEDADMLEDAGVKWYEIHHSMPYYGEYCPEVPEWRDGSCPPRMDFGKPITPKVINDCGATLARRGISALLYMQVTGDVWLPEMEKKFPESLARDKDGELFHSIIEGAFINSDPSLPFGKDMQRQIRGVLERYPDIAGVFLDQACYSVTDCAHDDGVTMYRNKPAYRLRFCYDKHLPDLVAGLHQRGKYIYSNGPYDIELQKGFDGNMAEGSSTVSKAMRYVHLAKPLMFFSYFKDEADVEDMFQECMLAGASWSVWLRTSEQWIIQKAPTPEQKRIYDRYVPVCERLLGRTILLEPNPVVFPKRAGVFAGEGTEISVGDDQSSIADWEIFQAEDGNILLSLVARRKRCLDGGDFSPNLEVVVRTRRAADFVRAYAVAPDYEGEMVVESRRDNDQLWLTLPNHGAASLVVLEMKDKRKGTDRADG